MRLKVKLVLTADPSPTGTLTLTRPPRQARYTLNETTGSGVYSGLAEKTGQTVRVTVDEDTRTLTIVEQREPPRTVAPAHWHLSRTKGAKHLRFGAEAAGLTLKGALHLGKDGRVGGYLKLREGERQKSHYALTARPTPSGPAGLFYIHTDHLDTPQVLSDDNQAIVWQADYMPFGEATLTKDNVTFNLRFPGQYFDSETGLHYNYFRDYDPSIGRYIQSDPIGLDGGINTYVYVLNNPTRLIDRSGLAPGDLYPTSDSAAYDAISDARSLPQNREYGGYIYEAPGNPGSFSYTEPRYNGNGSDHNFSPEPRDLPKGVSLSKDVVGDYHTHWPKPGYRSDEFSPDDIYSYDVLGRLV
ncbi:MAG: RHS repeat-associated core domain-containing protein [Candidatus Methylomirabilales bacterium]